MSTTALESVTVTCNNSDHNFKLELSYLFGRRSIVPRMLFGSIHLSTYLFEYSFGIFRLSWTRFKKVYESDYVSLRETNYDIHCAFVLALTYPISWDYLAFNQTVRGFVFKERIGGELKSAITCFLWKLECKITSKVRLGLFRWNICTI